MNVLGLVQLTQAAQETGGYAHSFGIEQLAARRELASEAQLRVAVEAVLHAAVGPADGVASGVTFRALRGGDFQEIPEVCVALSSERLPLEMRLASVQMGQRLWELSRHWEWAAGVHEELGPLARRYDLHHAVAFGALVSETTSSQVRAIAAYLLNVAKSLVGAAVRRVPLEERGGQRVLAEVQPVIVELAEACVDKHAGDIGVGGWDGTAGLRELA